MKEAFWGVLIIVLGLFGVVVVNLFQNVTVDNERVYYLIKESTEASAYDAIDLTYYRLSGDLRMVEDKFVENLTRRFAENVTIGTYEIKIFDLNEIPPKISLGITSGLGSLRGERVKTQNRVDAVIEAKYKLSEVLDFLGITESEWTSYINKAKPEASSGGGTGKCKLGVGSDDNASCISGDIVFTGFGATGGLKKSYCDTDTLPSNVSRTANYKECDCGEWVDKSAIVTANPVKSGRTATYTWRFTKTTDLRTINESIKEKVNIDVCTKNIAIQTPKDKDQLKPEFDPSKPTAFEDCPPGGIKIPIDTRVKLQIRYDPKNATNRRMEDANGKSTWKSTDSNKVAIPTISQPSYTCVLNSDYTNCIATAIITAKGIGTSTISATSTNGKTATCKVEVWDGSPDTMNCENMSVTLGENAVIKSGYTPKNASKTKFTFTSSDTSMATISGNTITTLKVGTVTITMKEVNSGKTTTCKLTINKPPVVVNPGGGSGGGGGGWVSYFVTDPVTGKTTWYGSDKARAEAAKEMSEKYPTKNVKSGVGNESGKSTTHEGVHKACPCFSCQEYRDYSKIDKTNTQTLKNSDGSTTTVVLKNGQVVSQTTTTPKSPKTGNNATYNGNGGGGNKGGGSIPGVNAPIPGKWSSYCFTSDTLVNTKTGLKRIESVEVGDEVLSYNFDKNSQEYRKVTKKLTHYDNIDQLYEIYYENKVMKVTGNHPIYINTNNNFDVNIVLAKNIGIGDYLLGSDGKYHKVTMIKHYGINEFVYNIEVENNNNYYVGPGILVSSV